MIRNHAELAYRRGCHQTAFCILQHITNYSRDEMLSFLEVLCDTLEEMREDNLIHLSFLDEAIYKANERKEGRKC